MFERSLFTISHNADQGLHRILKLGIVQSAGAVSTQLGNLNALSAMADRYIGDLAHFAEQLLSRIKTGEAIDRLAPDISLGGAEQPFRVVAQIAISPIQPPRSSPLCVKCFRGSCSQAVSRRVSGRAWGS